MAYGDFTLDEVVTKFGLHTVHGLDLFAAVPDVPPGDLLRGLLDRGTRVAIAIGTEKAKSELITAPVLLEVWHRLQPRASIFSGNEFPVDPARGLSGYCDFILSRSHEQEYITAPVMVVIEAKNDSLKSGLGQCAAGMVAAQLFNERKGNAVPAVYGAVTSGQQWRFLKLVGTDLFLDAREYYLDNLPKLLGILHHVMRDEPVTAAA